MGKLRDVIKKADNTGELTAEIKEALNLLFELASEKAKTFETQIDNNLRTAGTRENPTFPVAMKLASHQEIRITTEKKINDGITSEIGEALGQ